MPKIVPVVEGNGEVEAVPALCYKLLHEMQRYDIKIGAPLNAHGCGNLITKNGLEKFVDRAWNRPDCRAVLVLMDSDRDCPKQTAQSFSQRLRAMNAAPPCSVVTVLAKTEYEAWFLASLPSMAGANIRQHFTLPIDIVGMADAESKPGVKEWITKQIPIVEGKRRVAYDEVRDQVVMTRLIDPAEARKNSRSFRRLCHAIEQIVDAIDNNKIVVTP